MDFRISNRPNSAPSGRPRRFRSRSEEQTLWLGHTPKKREKVGVMTMEKMGTAERLHTSHFNCMAIAATSKKHQDLIYNARSRISTQLHPFVASERRRLKAKEHLRGVDALDKDHVLPDALKHHSGYHEVYGWLLTHEQHNERMGKLTPSISSSLPRHCQEYKRLRDKNRFKSMSTLQKKLFLQRRREEKIKKQEAAQRERDRSARRKLEKQEQALGDMKFASPTSDYSTTGLREAKFKSVGDVRTKEKSTEDYVERRKREAKEARSIRRNDSSSGFSTPKRLTTPTNDIYSTPGYPVYVDHYPRYDPRQSENYKTENISARQYGSAKLRGTSSTGMSPTATPIRRPKSSSAATRSSGLKFKMVHKGRSNGGVINTVENIMRTGVATQHRLQHSSSSGRSGWQDNERGESIRSRSERNWGERGGERGAIWRDDEYDNEEEDVGVLLF